MLSLRPFTNDFSDVLDVFGRDFSKSRTNTGIEPTTLRLDVKETDKTFEALFDVPGVPKNEVKISVDGQNLTVSVDHKEERKGTEGEKGKNLTHWRERSTGFASRTITLPDVCDLTQAKAKQDQGVLTISVPKKPDAEKKKYISIE